MKHNIVIRYGNLLLRQLKREDIEKLRQWRNRTEQTKFLRNVGYISEERQKAWFNNYLENSNEACFAIEEVNEINDLIGSVSIYDFYDDYADFGKIMIGDERAHGKGYGRIAMVMALKAAFEIFKIKKIVAEVHQENVTARTNDLRIGFSIIGKKESSVGGFEDIIEIDKERCSKTNDYYDKILLEGNIE